MYEDIEVIGEFDVFSRKNNMAPKKDEIDKVNDISVLYDLLSNALDVEIAIKTQLEYDVCDDELKNRRINALILWKIAIKNIKTRLNYLKAILKGNEVDTSIV